MSPDRTESRLKTLAGDEYVVVSGRDDAMALLRDGMLAYALDHRSPSPVVGVRVRHFVGAGIELRFADNVDLHVRWAFGDVMLVGVERSEGASMAPLGCLEWTIDVAPQSVRVNNQPVDQNRWRYDGKRVLVCVGIAIERHSAAEPTFATLTTATTTRINTLPSTSSSDDNTDRSSGATPVVSFGTLTHGTNSPPTSPTVELVSGSSKLDEAILLAIVMLCLFIMARLMW
jgi:hypothetical protein